MEKEYAQSHKEIHLYRMVERQGKYAILQIIREIHMKKDVPRLKKL